MAVISLNSEDLRSSTSGEGGGIEDDDVKFSSAAPEPAQPIKNLPMNEIVLFDRDIVVRIVSFSPIEVVAREVEVYSGSACDCCGDAKGASVCECVEDRFVSREVSELESIGALVEKESR